MCPRSASKETSTTHYVKPLAGKNSRAFVIISDALRYEVAAELCDTITRTTKGNSEARCCSSSFPSITKFGMAALLPGRKLSVNDGMDVLVDEMPTRSTDERGKVLRAANMNSVAVQYTDVLNMKRAERRELVSGKEVVYIYHNTIDAIGDKAPTEKRCLRLAKMLCRSFPIFFRIVINDMQGTDIFITADHGFLYTYSPLTEGDKLGKDAISGKVYEIGRRYVLAEPSAAARVPCAGSA